MEAIFLSYRRSDSEGQAGRLFENLVAHFGRSEVLLDVAGLEKGRDFRKTIESRLVTCKVMLALIGRGWADAKDDTGARRLHSPSDLVRIEIAAALRRDIPVIPVLVGGATMPRAEDLPDDLKDLVFRDGVEITHARWDSDVKVLVDVLRPHLAASSAPPPPAAAAPRPRPRWPKVLLVSGAVLAVGAGGWGVQQWQAQERAREVAAAAEQLAVERAAAEKAAAERAAADKAAADRAAAQTAAANKAAADKAAAQKLAADKAAAEKARAAAERALADRRAADEAAANRAAAERAAAEKAAAQAAAATKPAVAVDRVITLQLIASGKSGADFGVAYVVADHEPLRTSIRVCVSGSGLRYCGTRAATAGPGKGVVAIRYPEAAAANFSASGKNAAEACVVTYRDAAGDGAVVNGSCTTASW